MDDDDVDDDDGDSHMMMIMKMISPFLDDLFLPQAFHHFNRTLSNLQHL
jgi:hypothetical protein